MDVEKLRAMIEEDEFDLLKVPARQPALTEEDRLRDGFQEILDFVTVHGREPKDDVSDMAQATLAWRLKGIRGDAEQMALLADMDTAELLKISDEPPGSLDELFASDELDLLGGEDASAILDTSNLPERHESPDEVAQTKPAEDFEKFEPAFLAVHDELRTGRRKLVKAAKEENIREGAYFVVRGILCVIDQVGVAQKSRYGRTGERVRVVYENGTESDPLRRSFQRALHRYGKAVTDPALAGEPVALDSETEMGYVYVLKSLSDDPQVTSIPFLHKIGFTKQSVAERLAKAENAITFLKSPVEVVAEYQLPAVAAQKVEHVLHKLFAGVRVDATFQKHGVTVGEATEWFSVPRAVIDEAITLIENGAISNYAYDSKECKLVLA